jgi:hypothetical protein
MRRAMRGRPLLVGGVAFALLVVGVAWYAVSFRPFPPDTTPQGAYGRIALAVAERRTRDLFPYLETDAQWAAYTVRDLRRDACARVRASYPPAAQPPLLDAWHEEGEAPDGSDLFALVATRRGWIARLERDLSGVDHVEIQGERATVVTSRGTRYPFRLRDNGVWGLTIFTAELGAEAERAARDLDVVKRAAADYERARGD